MNTEFQKQGDPSPIIALAGLAAIVGLLLYLDKPTQVEFWQTRLDQYFDLNFNFISALILSFLVNAMGLGSLLTQSLGINRQGGRLALLAGDRRKGASTYERIGIPILIALCAGITTFLFLGGFEYPGKREFYPLPLTVGLITAFTVVVQSSFSITAAILSVILIRVSTLRGLRRGLFRRLPSFPAIKNGIVIGSTGDDISDSKPEWITLGRRALNGNVLITGSIGTGKTQGTILNYTDQIFSNFEPRPSMLMIDPKGTFIPEALKMIKKRGLEEHVLHLKLDGNVSFNPFYSANIVKDAEFQNMAQMLRSAALNFSGKGTDSPFWELSAFNLMKGCLALCAAKRERAPFTLTDLYDEMVLAATDGLSAADKLKSLAQSQKFDVEEVFNILRTAKYFREFDQMDEKLRSGILATGTAFLSQFQEYQASQIFCPKEGEATIQSMDEIVDQGKILLVDIASPGLARSMGTLIKLHYEQSVLNRLKSPSRGVNRPAVLIADEYQDVVSTGGGVALGDDRFCAKSREANAIAIFATQSLTSLKNSIGKEDSAKELFQGFRTMISGHSTDLFTIHSFQELMGQEDRKRVSHSFSENAQRPTRNLLSGGFEVKDANISESISTSEQKEYLVTGKEFSTLSTFECFGRIYDGNQTYFKKLFLKPYFLEKKNLLHSKVLTLLKTAAPCLLLLSMFHPLQTYAFPNVCTVVKTPAFNSCLNFNVGACMCGFPPRPCAQFSYYVPRTFIEVFPDSKSSYFGDLPGAAIQLGTVGSKHYGAESDTDTQSFQAHALNVPLTMIPFSTLPCGVDEFDRTCFGSMSEHLGSKWENGSADSLQPNFLAWGLSPKACILKGAATSFTGEPGVPGNPTMPSCSFSLEAIPKYPPSAHSACNGWGIFYPRSGVYNGPSQAAGALMIASRLKSLGNEVFQTIPSSIDEEWQMITPQASSCFREGQNVGLLETIQGVREEQRLITGKRSGFLFTVWNKVSCCRDLAEIPSALAAIEVMNVTCQALGSL